MSHKIKIALADDHTILRQSLSMSLEQEPAFHVIGSAGNGSLLLQIVEKEIPDIILLDLEMPVMNGWETLEQLKLVYPSIKVIIVSMHFEGLSVKDLVMKGARGFLPKDSDFRSLIDAVFDVSNLGYFFDTKIPYTIVNDLLESKAIDPSFNAVSLSDKEQETLELICKDKLTKEIADLLSVSERTVERYKTGLYEKTKAKTYAGLVLFALKHDLYSM